MKLHIHHFSCCICVTKSCRRFFTECMVYKDDANLASRHIISEIYTAYKNYCHSNGIEHFKTMNEFKKRIAEYKEITVDELMAQNEKGTCFAHYDLTKEVIRDNSPFFMSA